MAPENFPSSSLTPDRVPVHAEGPTRPLPAVDVAARAALDLARRRSVPQAVAFRREFFGEFFGDPGYTAQPRSGRTEAALAAYDNRLPRLDEIERPDFEVRRWRDEW